MDTYGILVHYISFIYKFIFRIQIQNWNPNLLIFYNYPPDTCEKMNVDS